MGCLVDRKSKELELARALCQHSRNTRGARPLLFMRYVGDAPTELTRIQELYSLLRLWAGADIRRAGKQIASGELRSGYLEALGVDRVLK